VREPPSRPAYGVAIKCLGRAPGNLFQSRFGPVAVDEQRLVPARHTAASRIARFGETARDRSRSPKGRRSFSRRSSLLKRRDHGLGHRLAARRAQ
jgi:hypothetical protein